MLEKPIIQLSISSMNLNSRPIINQGKTKKSPPLKNRADTAAAACYNAQHDGRKANVSFHQSPIIIFLRIRLDFLSNDCLKGILRQSNCPQKAKEAQP